MTKPKPRRSAGQVAKPTENNWWRHLREPYPCEQVMYLLGGSGAFRAPKEVWYYCNDVACIRHQASKKRKSR